jgi:CRP-like cAMP-binding protein
MPRKTPLRKDDLHPDVCSTHLRLRLLGKVPFFAGLSAPALDAVNRLFRDAGYTPGETIYTEGQPAERLCVVATGKVKLVRHALDGQEVILGLLGQGELFGSLALLGAQCHPESALAHTTACVLIITPQDFQSILFQHPQVALNVLEVVSRRLDESQDRIRQLSADPAERRVAHALLKLGETLGEERGGECLLQVPVSRQDLASMTGTTPETVSRILSQFRREGLVRSGRQWIAITDHRRLSQAAGVEEK